MVAHQVEPKAIEVLPKIVWHYGEPFADPSAVPTYYVSQLARQSVKVALNGDGGDESFLGYARYSAMRHLSRFDRLPSPVKLLLDRVLASAAGLTRQRYRIGRLRDLLRSSASSGARHAPLQLDFDVYASRQVQSHQ